MSILLSREELTKLLPEKWITNYEQIHQAPVQTTTTPEFIRHQDGHVEVRFDRQDRRDVFSSMHMMQPVEAPAQTSHNPFDICDCQDCLDEAYKLEYEEEDNQRKKKGSQFTLKQRYEAGDPTVGLLGEPSGKFDYYVLYGDSKPKPKPPKPSPPPPLKHPPTPPKECFTLTPAPSPQNYHTEFPPLSTFENVQQKARHSWKIENPTTIGANGVQHQITPAEATLNWQSENAVAQNNALRSIIAKQEDLLKSQAALSNRMTGLEGIIYEIKNKILGIHNELLQMAYNNPGMDGHVEVRFDRQDRRDVFSSMHMMQPVEAPAQTPHNPFDVCDCQDCLDEAYKLEYEEEDNQRKKKGSQFTLKQRYEAGDPTVGLLGEPSGKFDYYVLYGDSKPKPKPPKPSPPPPLKHPPTPPKECFTLTPAPSPQNYHTEFPPLSTFENVQQKARHSWKIENPTTIGANGVQHQVTPAEATLNWQSENAVAQNNALRSIIAKQEDLLKSQAALSNRMTGLEGIIYEIKNKILGIHNELLQMAYNNPGMIWKDNTSSRESQH
ncbi:hypothetical protein QVD17_35026 [Tagetes erecta]|uniref:Uncharacterized protein n=1 Tax=Tagetes erecta TaxID=13708 RepID=A0AAD8JYM4_TARER|nr:hypothetical protein QVD17_35016 [Tagetes erecta]KAK1413255.1 hypothetical protein QVD17_35026 [Tagetes erecta]